MGPRVQLFGLRFTAARLRDVVAEIGARLESDEEPCLVVTPNVDHVVRLSEDQRFREAYGRASMIVADGMPIVWMSRLLGKSLPERVAGSDLLPAVCEHAAKVGWQVFLLGGLDGVAPAAAKKLQATYARLRVCGAYSPPLGFDRVPSENEYTLGMIRTAKPDIVFVGLGSPKQEYWASEHLDFLHARVVLCVGAALDFAAGKVRRAPRWMRRAGLEWLYRLLKEPRRLWRRYLVRDLRFIGIAIRELRNTWCGAKSHS